jgi:SAM-dependent methyltransferase
VALSDFFSRLRKPDSPSNDARPPAASALPTKALAKFLSGLSGRDQPALLDLGSVVGGNLNFFGEQLGCKIFVEDIYADIDRHVREGKLEALAEFFKKRFPQKDSSFDGVLCWDVMDYLDRASAQELAAQMMRVLRPDGALLAFFATTSPREPRENRYTKYIIVDEVNLKHRSYAAARGRGTSLLNRDIIRMFSGLRVSDSFLLQNNLREILFRKPVAS